ncbi:MAG: DUF4276 family protein [Clostridia bacterium]|nr:DUF4276 family protein [Clostridia bacterium]
MKRVIVYCEGPTEETFVNRLLAPIFYPNNIFLSASSCNGVSKYSIIKKDLKVLCSNDRTAIITTMLDYYAFPSDAPGMQNNANTDIYSKVQFVEDAIKADIGANNLIPNLMLHEFEALLFSRPECFSYCGLPQRKLQELCDIRAKVETPEHINNNPSTAPSKRILSLYPAYSKFLDGYNIAEDIGIDVMRSQCLHFNEWINKLAKINEI